jgi:hypothetical protein
MGKGSRGSGSLRGIAFRLVAVLLGLLLLEAAALGVEALRPDKTRSLPTPGPGDASDFEALVEREQDNLGHVLPMVEDEARDWSLKPGEEIITHDGYPIVVNSMKLRGPELTPIEPGEVRLMTLGDSSIFGHNVQMKDVFSTVAAERLTESWGRPVTPVIGATPGYDTGQSYDTLEMFGLEVEPAWVVIGTIWSDIYIRKAFDEAQEAGEINAPLIHDVLDHLATYRLALRLLRPYIPTQKVPWIGGEEDIGMAADGSDCRVPLAPYTDNLREMARLAGELGARPVFLVLPAPMDFDNVPPPETVRNYRTAMRQVAEDVDAPLVDGPAYFKEHEAGIAWFMDQVHPTAVGHHLIGEALADALAPIGPPPAGASLYGDRTFEAPVYDEGDRAPANPEHELPPPGPSVAPPPGVAPPPQ